MINFASNTIKANIILEIEIKCCKFYLVREPEACSKLVNPFLSKYFSNFTVIHTAPIEPFCSHWSLLIEIYLHLKTGSVS